MAHPYVADFLRAESRFMQAVVVKPQRFHKPDKVYEVQNCTFDTAMVPWNAETRKQYANWLAPIVPERMAGVNIVQLHLAQAEPVSRTVDGKDIQPVDHGVTPPHCCYTVDNYESLNSGGIQSHRVESR